MSPLKLNRIVTFFCLDAKRSNQKKDQGCMHFLTAPSIKFPKQAQTPPYGRQTVPLFLTEIKYSPPKMPKADFLTC